MMKRSVSIKNIVKSYPRLNSKLYIFLRNLILPFSILEKYVPKKGKIIDVGCGFGGYSIYFALKEPKRNLLGYDLNKKRIIEAKNASKNLKNISFKVKDLTKDSNLNCCDCILLIDILHHIPTNSQYNIIKESYNKLKTGGILLIKDIDRKPFWKFCLNFLHDKIMTFNDRLFFSSSSGLSSLLKSINFKILKMERINVPFWNIYPHYIIIAKKNESSKTGAKLTPTQTKFLNAQKYPTHPS